MLMDLLHHCQWADAAFWRAWHAYQKESANPIDLHQRLFHLHITQKAFADMITLGKFEYRPADTFDSVKVFEALGIEALTRLCDAAEQRDIGNERVHLPWFGEPRFEPLVIDALTTVALHSQHHRGQNIMLLKQAGSEMDDVDYIMWVQLGKPRA